MLDKTVSFVYVVSGHTCVLGVSVLSHVVDKTDTLEHTCVFRGVSFVTML